MAYTTTSNVDVFRDLILGTTSTNYSGPEALINDATRFQTYYSRFEMAGAKFGETIQATGEIIDQILLDVPQRAQFYDPAAGTFAYQRDDVLTQWTTNWKFLLTHMTWTEHEIILNTGSLTGGALKETLKKLLKAKDMACSTDLVDTVEASAWAPPSASTMEAKNGMQPYSVLAFVSELTTGLPPNWTGYTTVMGISPTAKPNWKNATQGYTDLPKVGTDLFPALSQACRKVNYQPQPWKGGNTQENALADFTFFTSNLGITNYEDSLRINQDEFRNGSSGQDPHYGMPTFRGIPFDYVAALDNAAVWPTGGGGTLGVETATTNSNAGPRYVGLTRKHIKCVWHANRFMHRMDEIRPENQPHVHVVPTDTWMQRLATSRRRHVIVHPSSNLA